MKDASVHLRAGSFIVVYDGDEREGEADLMVHPKFCTPEKIQRLRADAGGLICMAVGGEEAQKLGLGFMSDLLEKAGYGKLVPERTAYGDKPAFSLAVNHNNVFTGIPDKDRSLTIVEMEKAITLPNGKEYFEKNFYSPGHVFLLISRGLENRKGHTELGVELAKKAGLSPAMVMCEMLGKGKALSKNEAREYALKHNFTFMEGKQVLEEASERSER